METEGRARISFLQVSISHYRIGSRKGVLAMKKLTIDFNNFQTLDEFHEFIMRELDLDSDYERNLDALRNISDKVDCEFEVIKGGLILEEMQEIVAAILSKNIS